MAAFDVDSVSSCRLHLLSRGADWTRSSLRAVVTFNGRAAAVTRPDREEQPRRPDQVSRFACFLFITPHLKEIGSEGLHVQTVSLNLFYFLIKGAFFFFAQIRALLLSFSFPFLRQNFTLLNNNVFYALFFKQHS